MEDSLWPLLANAFHAGLLDSINTRANLWIILWSTNVPLVLCKTDFHQAQIKHILHFPGSKPFYSISPIAKSLAISGGIWIVFQCCIVMNSMYLCTDHAAYFYVH